MEYFYVEKDARSGKYRLLSIEGNRSTSHGLYLYEENAIYMAVLENEKIAQAICDDMMGL